MRLFLPWAALAAATCPTDDGKTSACADGWIEGKGKCYKFVLKRSKMNEAMAICKNLGGQVFQPQNRLEYDQIKHMSSKLGIQKRNSYWMALKLKDTKSTQFPPEVSKLNGDPAPEWINDRTVKPLYGKVPAGTDINAWIRSGRNRRFNFNMMKVNDGKINLTRRGHKSFFAANLCEMEIPKLSIGDPDVCWQPPSTQYNKVEYTGTQSRTSGGFECANWDDESVYEHKIKPADASHNYCRNPDNGPGGPWCYHNEPNIDWEGNPQDALKWDYCPVSTCSAKCDDSNEFVKAQADCGNRPVFNQPERIIGGHDAKFGEVPYQARIRYYRKLSFGSQKSDHQCGNGISTNLFV